MKTFKITLLLILGLGTFSCQNWLDVDPKAEVKSDKMFEREQGFKDAIIGCYMQMSASTLYGKDLTAGFLEAAAQQFDITNVAGNDYYSVRQLDWTTSTTRDMIDRMWNGLYNAIANVNNIIENIDQRRSILHTTHYNIIKGEAYGLRAFLHFELLRLFGYGDLTAHPEYMDKVTIPYSLMYNKVYADQYTERDVIAMAIDDLKTAIGLLESYDPWSPAAKAPDYSLPNADGFYNNRSTRFNYWAAQSTLARIHMWTGNYAEALPIIRNFIESRAAIDGPRWIRDNEINASSEADRDLSFSMEHIFRLDVSKLWDNLKAIMDPNNNPMGANSYLFSLTQTDFDALYENNDAGGRRGASDYRYMRQFTISSGKASVRKYIDFDNYRFPNRMPLIKMSEMYYMAVECLCDAGETVEAVKLLNEVRQNRGIAPEFMIDEDADETEIMAELEKEWRKEFMGEGQMFLWYKRNGAEKMGRTTITEPIYVYVFPIPEDEINVGGRENNLPPREKE